MRLRSRATLGLVALALVGSAAVVGLRDAEAQKVDPRRANVFVVGSPPGAAPMQRVDARRTGFSKTPLPTSALRTAWKKTTGLSIDQAALTGADGTLAIISVRGDVTFLDEAGEERSTVKVGAAQVGPAAMTSDGTVVYATNAGDVFGIRRSQTLPRFTTRIGGDRNIRAAPLALDDGGVVIATITELIVLDSEGNVRSRVTLPEKPDAPLLATSDKVIAITDKGSVYGWTPGREAVRLGSFSAPVDGGAVIADGRLVAVIEGNHLAEVDLARGGRSTRAIAPQGIYLGPPSTRVGNAGAPTTTLLSLTHSREFVVTLDAAGQELLRAPVASFSPTPLPDGGVPALVAPPHTGTLVDARGTIAFASTDGHVGVVSPEGAVESIGEVLCSKGVRSGVVGLTPFGNGAFAVTCDSGIVARIAGPNAAERARNADGPRGADSAGPLRTPPPSTSAGPPRTLRPDARGGTGD